jgi:hypothetical protein
MTKLLAPNGKPSNLTAEQYILVRTPAFIEWFGDWQNDPENASKVIDENGEPLVVYHGTNNQFTIFNRSIETNYRGKFEILVDNVDVDSDTFKKIQEYNEEKGSMGAFTEFWFSNINWMPDSKYVMACFLNCKKLYVNENGQGGQGAYNSFYGDGLKITNADGQNGVDYYVVSNSNQIKIADGTNTTFNADNPDIRFKGGGEVKYLKGKKTQIWNILKNHYLSEQEAEENEENYSRINIFEDGDLADFAQVKAFDKNLYFDFDMLEKQIKEIAKNPSVTLIELEYGDYEKRVTDWLILYEKDKFNDGGEVIINPTEIECHKCHWHWKVKDGGDDLFICHKCFTDNSKYYKFEGLE